MTATPGSVHSGRDRFAKVMQSALTLGEVEDGFLLAAREAIPASSLGLYHIDPETTEMVSVQAKVEVDFLEEYEEYGRSDDPVLTFVLQQHRPIDSTRAASTDRWQHCGAREAIAISNYVHSLEAPVIVSGLLCGTINFARTAQYCEFTDTDLTSARILGEHLGLATERALRFEVTGQRTNALEHALDRVPQAIVVTDLDAHVLFRNRAARQSLTPTAPAKPADGPIGDIIVEAMQEFRLNGKRASTACAVDPLTGHRSIVKSYRLSDKGNAAVSLVYGDPQGEAVKLPSWNVLSKREQEIVDLVSQGLTNKQIAERAYVSENTVKQHLKRVFAKTDVHNRAELMQRIWSAHETSGAAT